MSIKVLELALIVAVAFGIGFWQLYDVNKELKKDRQRDETRAAATDAATDNGRDSND
ncbi:hypothetical protein HFP89_06825 [Wenzhouxiangella sp. XN79A]|uniref:hypothetical protein n=1 Tax=Wenzhouxiangella sp. XN79A TaxID=2724193 RepID=UPI00144A78CF|nr:hypothetical protein [Wenzhouxiangella sp. XN79A]NKI34873.1 hypothetical protein [Wenzhouxiangella sp. XN79A]